MRGMLPAGAKLAWSQLHVRPVYFMVHPLTRLATWDRVSFEHPKTSSNHGMSTKVIGVLGEEDNVVDFTQHPPPPQHDDHPPIDRLPVEVLAHIFSYVAPEEIPPVNQRQTDTPTREAPIWPPYPKPLRLLPDVGSLVKTTHVCSRWRSAALTHGSLWAGLDLSRISIEAIPSIFARSAEHVLHIKASDKRRRLILESLLGHGDWSRIRSLEVRCTVPELAELSQQGDLSALEFLSAENAAAEGITVPDALFTPSYPVAFAANLSCLILRNLRISWKNFPQLTQLTRLELWFRDLINPQFLAISADWCRAGQLRGNGRYSAPSSPPPATGTDPNLPTVSLPHLVSLRLEGCGDMYVRLFSTIDMPPTVSLAIDLAPDFKHALDVLFSRCLQIVQGQPCFEYNCSQAELFYSTTLAFWDRHEANWNMEKARVRLTLQGATLTPDVVIWRARKYFPLEEIVHFSVGTDSVTHVGPLDYTSQTTLFPICDILQDTQSVTHLKIFNEALFETISALADAPGDGPKHLKQNGTISSHVKKWWCFPKLRCLEIDLVPGDDRTPRALVNALRKRHDFGARLEELRFSHPCDIAETQRVRLQRYVDNPIDFGPQSTSPRQRPSHPAWRTAIPTLGLQPTSLRASHDGRGIPPPSFTGYTTEQEYYKELTLSGLRHGPSELLPLGHRLQLLRDYQRAIRMASGHFRHLPALRTAQEDSDLRVRASANIVSQMQSMERKVVFTRYPSRRLGITEEYSWSVAPASRWPFLEHAIDTNQDLLVLVERVLQGGLDDCRGYISIHVLSMGAGRQHPLADRSPLNFPFEWTSESNIIYDLQICGGQLSLLCVDRAPSTDSTAVVWNWKKAEKRMELFDMDLCTFAFLDEDYTLTGIIAPGSDWSIVVHDLRIQDPMRKCLNHETHSYEFELPEAYNLESFEITSEPYLPQHPGSPGYHGFQLDNLLTIFLDGKDSEQRPLQMKMFVAGSTLRKLMLPPPFPNDETSLAYSWVQWGPLATHIELSTGARMLGRCDITSCMRFADLRRDNADGKVGLTLLDLSPARVDQADREPKDPRQSQIGSLEGVPPNVWNDDGIEGGLRFLHNRIDLPSELQSIPQEYYHPTVTEDMVVIHPNWVSRTPSDLPMSVFIFF
ncbi:hypothetical protein EVG20_g4132 [Dentipellis fragilis]|uniref:F-box domain-containing protein n=1 Tax=Dentipellis fragilis TaxID=205917 RepID=A0A4Y9YYX5_9AGAM|nr:hypothetical protein EVG20_g4132 [Dentipellis fragilis]